MKFINFMLIMLGIVGASLILISLLNIFLFKTPENLTSLISYLSFATGILYLLFIFLILKISKKSNEF